MPEKQIGLQPAEKKRLQVKDLVTIGILNAVILVVTQLLTMVTMLALPLMLFTNTLAGIVAGPLYMLLVAKVPCRWVFIITGVLQGLIYLVMGNPYMAGAIAVGGLLAELIAGAGKYRRTLFIVLGYAALNTCQAFGVFGMAIVSSDAYIQTYVNMGQSPAMFEQVVTLLAGPLAIAIFAGAFAGGVLGGIVGNRLLKKHFVKAGIV